MNKLIFVLILCIIIVIGLICNKKYSEKFQSSNQYYLSQSLRGCPNTNRIKTRRKCQEASDLLASKGFNKEVNASSRTPGCFLDPNGYGYFNNRDLNNSTDDGLWGNGICVLSGSSSASTPPPASVSTPPPASVSTPPPAPASTPTSPPASASASGTTPQTQGCNYDNTTPQNDEECDTCVLDMNCPMSQCSNVCGLPECNQPTNVNNNVCRKYGIIDLYRPVFDRFNRLVRSLENSDVNPVNVDFDVLAKSNVNERELGSSLWNSVKNLYELNSLHTRSNFVDKKNLEELVNQQNEKLDTHRVTITDLSELNSTAKRHIEINMNKYRKMEYQLSVLKYILFAIMALVLIPILTFLKILDKKIGMVVIVFLLIVIAIVSYFFLFVKNVDRDNNDFKEFNFYKPTDEQVARSKMLSEMSKRDKARCQALSELEDDFDPASLNIDISQYRSRDSNQSDRCASIRTNDYS